MDRKIGAVRSAEASFNRLKCKRQIIGLNLPFDHPHNGDVKTENDALYRSVISVLTTLL